MVNETCETFGGPTYRTLNAELLREQHVLQLQKAKVEDIQARMHQIQRSCNHRWGPSVEDPIIHPGGSSPGDPPGTMGVDWRGPSSWAERREPRWSRTCFLCTLKQYNTGIENIPRPKWSD